MYSFVTSRFTRTTEDECKRYLARIGKQCLYGSSNLISSSVPEGGLVFVIEMRINAPGAKPANWLPDDNQISGIGMIVNEEVPPDFYCDVYENKLFNQFTYMGENRFDRTELLQTSPLLIELLETILFKGKTHQKRNAYLSVLNDDFLKEIKVYIKLHEDTEDDPVELIECLMDEHGYYKTRNIVKTQVELAIQRGEIDPNHLNDLLQLDVKQTIVDMFKRKRVQFLNGKRKAAPTTDPIIVAPTPLKHNRGNNDDEQLFADFYDGCEAATMIPGETDDGNEYDFTEFLELWRSEEGNLKADAKEEELYNAIYNGANIEAATV